MGGERENLKERERSNLKERKNLNLKERKNLNLKVKEKGKENKRKRTREREIENLLDTKIHLYEPKMTASMCLQEKGSWRRNVLV